MRSWSSSGRPTTSRIVSFAERTATCELRRIDAATASAAPAARRAAPRARDEVGAQGALGVDRLRGQQHLQRRRSRRCSPAHDPAVPVVVAATRLERAEPARSEATRMSQASASSSPPASAQPLTAAIVGL